MFPYEPFIWLILVSLDFNMKSMRDVLFKHIIIIIASSMSRHNKRNKIRKENDQYRRISTKNKLIPL